jgi:hypothetical protein
MAAEGWLGILPADGSATVREIGPHVTSNEGSHMDDGWSPDGRTILPRFDDDHFYTLDATTGLPTPVTWSIDKIPDWQRIAL